MNDPFKNPPKRSFQPNSGDNELQELRSQLNKYNDQIKRQYAELADLNIKLRKDGIRSQKIKQEAININENFNVFIRKQSNFFMNAYKNTGSPLFENENGLCPFELIGLQLTRFENMEPTICMVCFEDLSMGTAIFKLPCQHLLHRDCGIQSLLYSKLCPACNNPLK